MSTEQTTPTITPRAQEVAQGLRELADWLEARPELPVMYVIASIAHISSDVEGFPTEPGPRERFLGLTAAIDRPEPERTASGAYRLTRTFTGGVEITLTCEGSVLLAPQPVAPWPEDVRALAPDADWGGAS